MWWWVHKAVEVLIRIIVPVAGLLIGGLLIWYGTRLLVTRDDGSRGWEVIVSSVVILGPAGLLLVLANRKKARAKWVPYVLPKDDSPASVKVDEEKNPPPPS